MSIQTTIPSLDTDFKSLSENPLTHEQMHRLKEAQMIPHQKSRKKRNAIALGSVATALVFLASLSPDQKEQIQFIDYLLVASITWSIGFLVWGWMDDRIFARYQFAIKVDGVRYQRRAYESLREKKSFWDPDSIEDIIVPRDAEDVHRYIDNVLHNVGRGFVRFDRELIRYTLNKNS